jgi:hypothetical protein
MNQPGTASEEKIHFHVETTTPHNQSQSGISHARLNYSANGPRTAIATPVRIFVEKADALSN